SRSGSVRSEQRRLRPKDMPPCGLRPIWPVASLLGRSSIAADTLPPSRLATGQIGRNERLRIYEIDHLENPPAGISVWRFPPLSWRPLPAGMRNGGGGTVAPCQGEENGGHRSGSCRNASKDLQNRAEKFPPAH